MDKRKILLVDDEKGFALTLKLNLEATEAYEVRIENNANNALNTALQFHPDLVLLDVIMPGKEGPDVAFDFKHNDFMKEVPIIFLTATITREEVVDQHGKIGGHSFVAKPSPLNDLFSSIEEQLIPA